MLSCRICCSEENLKYTQHELRQILKNQRNGKQQVIKNASSNFGNICHDCDHRLRTYHQGQDSDIDDINIDVDGSLPIRPMLKDSAAAAMPKNNIIYDNYVHDLKKSDHMKNDLNIVAIVDLSLDSDNENEKENQINSILGQNEYSHNDKYSEKKREDGGGLNKSVHRKKRKRYNESAFRLLASFSLLSSDSESEDGNDGINQINKASSDVKVQSDIADGKIASEKSTPTTLNLNNNTKTTNNNNIGSSTNLMLDCDKCFKKSPDTDPKMKQQQIITPNTEKCPVCGILISEPIRLINHMRRKHRNYPCPLLTERPRCARDSAMTIRLRYQKRYLFYECQLCGRIDSLLKKHKAHILSEHAQESKSLDDPLINQNIKVKRASINCPVCNHDSGPSNIELIKHMVNKHKKKDYKKYVKEIYKFEKFKRQIVPLKSIKKTARVYKLNSTEHLFFQCRLCQNVELNCTDHVNHTKKQHPKRQIGTTVNSQTGTKVIIDVSQNKLRAKTPKYNENIKAIEKCIKLKKTNIKTSKKPTLPPLIRSMRMKNFNCKYCSMVCTSFLSLNKHLITNHAADEYFSCETCSKSFCASERVQQHSCKQLLHEQKRKNSCQKISS